MSNIKFTEFDKLTIIEGGLDFTVFYCPDDGVYLKYKNIHDSKCPWCNKSNDPIENVRELRKKFKKELGL